MRIINHQPYPFDAEFTDGEVKCGLGVDPGSSPATGDFALSAGFEESLADLNVAILDAHMQRSPQIFNAVVDVCTVLQ